MAKHVSSRRRQLLYLLSHHPSWRLNRCLRLRLGSRKVYLCARCTGIFTGIITGLILSYLISLMFLHFNWPPSEMLVLFGSVLALPTFVDWCTQTAGIRESNNKLRVLTGFIAGYGMWLLLSIMGTHLELALISVNLYIVGTLSVHLIWGRRA